MTRSLRCQAARMPLVLVTMFIVLVADAQGAESLNDQKAKRALAQKPPDWGQALTYLLLAHKEDRTNAERYRLIAACLQGTSHPLAAMAWHQTYRAVPGVDAEKAAAAGVQVELLEVDVRSKMGALFTEAVNVAEKQIKEKVGFKGGKFTYADSLFSLPRMQAEAGMTKEAQATSARIGELGVTPANYSVFLELSRLPFYRTHPRLASLADRHVFAAALVGDATTVRVELAKVANDPPSADDESDRSVYGYTCHEQWGYLAELIRFNLSNEDNYRLIWAEQLTQDDPMENLDARSGKILRQDDVGGIPLALGSLGKSVGQTLMRVRAMGPENAKPELSDATRKYAIKHARTVWSMGLFANGGEDYARVTVRACSRLADVGTVQAEDGLAWPGIAWALKQRKEGRGGVGDETIALLSESGMGVNDPIVTPVKDAEGNTALHWAVQINNLAAVELLLANKADPALKNKAGRTPLDIAQTPYRLVGAQLAIGDEITKRLQRALSTR